MLETVASQAVEFSEDSASIKSVSYSLACNYSLLKDDKNAERYLRLAMATGDNNYKQILTENALNNIRTTSEFKAVMKKYFPDQYK